MPVQVLHAEEKEEKKSSMKIAFRASIKASASADDWEDFVRLRGGGRSSIPKDFRFHSTFKENWLAVEDESTVFGQEYLFRMVRCIKFI